MIDNPSSNDIVPQLLSVIDPVSSLFLLHVRQCDNHAFFQKSQANQCAAAGSVIALSSTVFLLKCRRDEEVYLECTFQIAQS